MARGGRSRRGGRGGRGDQGGEAEAPVFDPILFHSLETFERWGGKGGFQTRGVEPGRVILTAELAPHYDVGALFEAVGWGGILRIQTQSRPALVRYFFTNLKYHTEEPDEDDIVRYSLTSRVRGVDVHIIEEMVEETLGLSRGGESLYWEPMGEMAISQAEYMAIRTAHLRPDFEEEVRPILEPRKKIVDFREQDLRDLPRVLSRILQHNVLPQANHRDEIPSFRLFVTDCLLRGRRLNLPYIIMCTIVHTLLAGRASALPYGRLITHLLERVFRVDVTGVGWEVSEPKDGTPFGILALRKMKGLQVNLGPTVREARRMRAAAGGGGAPQVMEEELEEEEEVAVMAAGGLVTGDPAVGGSSAGGSSSQTQRGGDGLREWLESRLDSMERRMSQRYDTLEQQVLTLRSFVEGSSSSGGFRQSVPEGFQEPTVGSHTADPVTGEIPPEMRDPTAIPPSLPPRARDTQAAYVRRGKRHIQ